MITLSKIDTDIVHQYVPNLFLSLLTFILFFACENDDTERTEQPTVNTITVITGTERQDDQGFNSLIYQTLSQLGHQPGLSVNILHPKNQNTAKDMYQYWIASTKEQKSSLLILTSSEYQDFLENDTTNLKENQRILAFEMRVHNKRKGVSSFTFNRKSACFLAGRMASKCNDILIIAPNGLPYINKAWESFQLGLQGQHNLNVEYLSDNHDGFSNPDSAYYITTQYPDAFVLPLAKKSNLGVYHFLNECSTNNKIVAVGMDVDCNTRNPRIPFSIVLHADKVLNQYILEWKEGKKWPLHQSFGMQSGMIEVILNPQFKETGGIKKSDYENLYYLYKKEAMDREQTY